MRVKMVDWELARFVGTVVGEGKCSDRLTRWTSSADNECLRGGGEQCEEECLAADHDDWEIFLFDFFTESFVGTCIDHCLLFAVGL